MPQFCRSPGVARAAATRVTRVTQNVAVRSSNSVAARGWLVSPRQRRSRAGGSGCSCNRESPHRAGVAVARIRPLRTKLLAFAVSSFYCGIAGAMWAFIYTGGVEALAFDIDRSFQILFMIIIGGLGSILGSFLGAAFIVLLPIFLDNAPRLVRLTIPVNTVSNLQSMIFGALIIFFLIVEPRGLARLWQIGKEKLRLWPFPY